MEKDFQLELYDSERYEYELACRLRVFSQQSNSPSRNIVSSVLFRPKTVKIYDNEQYLQINMFFNTESIEFDKFNMAMNEDHAEASIPDTFVWTSIDVIPDSKFDKNFLNLFTMENILQTKISDSELVISFCSPTKSATITIDNEETYFPYNRINEIIGIDTISEEEDHYLDTLLDKHNMLEFTHPRFEKSKKFFSSLMGVKPKDKGGADTQLSNNLIESLHMTEQEKQIFNPEMLSVSRGSSDAMGELNGLIGLDNVKKEIQKLKAKLLYRAMQASRKIFVDNSSSMHMCFTGSPGTGKTTVARIITGILYNMGYVKENKCIEVNGQNLKGGYTGQTAIITKLVLKSAKNKVLFIDEAYALFDDYENGFGKEAIVVILKQMEDERDNTTIIFAGYKDDMEQFLQMNDGLKSRINRYIDFRNYTPMEMCDIMMSYLKHKRLYIKKEALKKCVITFKKARMSSRFSNGRFVRNMLEKIEYEHAYNTHGIKDATRQDTITITDIPSDLIEELLTRSM